MNDFLSPKIICSVCHGIILVSVLVGVAILWELGCTRACTSSRYLEKTREETCKLFTQVFFLSPPLVRNPQSTAKIITTILIASSLFQKQNATIFPLHFFPLVCVPKKRRAMLFESMRWVLGVDTPPIVWSSMALSVLFCVHACYSRVPPCFSNTKFLGTFFVFF